MVIKQKINQCYNTLKKTNIELGGGNCGMVAYTKKGVIKEEYEKYGNALPNGETKYQDNVKYFGKVPQVKFINPKLIIRKDENEVNRVSDEVADNMEFIHPIQVTIYNDGSLICQNGHHRLAAAKQRNMALINVELFSLNAYGKNINKLIWNQNVMESSSINELHKHLCESYGIELSKSGMSKEETGKVKATDQRKVDNIVNNKSLPDVAEKGKAYIVHWADGRGIFACKKKSYLQKWLDETGDWAEIVSIKYKDNDDSLKVINESATLVIPLNKLFTPDWKFKETLHHIKQGKLSQTSGPITVSKMDNGYFIINGNHRAIQALLNGEKSIKAKLDDYIPNISNSGGAYDDMIKSCVNIASNLTEMSDVRDLQNDTEWNDSSYKMDVSGKPLKIIKHKFDDKEVNVGIYKDEQEYLFINMENKEKIADLEYGHVNIIIDDQIKKNVESSSHVSVVGNYRGKGFAKVIYREVIELNGFCISDTKLTSLSRKIWKDLMKEYSHKLLISNGRAPKFWISTDSKNNIDKFNLKNALLNIEKDPLSIWFEPANKERVRIILIK